jgi:RNA polymerase sporulation-specific sigma factor
MIESIKKYEPLVHKLALKMQWMAPEYSSYEDLVQEGKIGLIKALNTYDPSKKTKFLTWAYIQVRGSISTSIKAGRSRERDRAVKNSLGVHLDPDYFFFPENKLQELLSLCSTTLQREAVVYKFGLLGKPELKTSEIAELLGVSPQKVNSLVYAFRKKAGRRLPELSNYL